MCAAARESSGMSITRHVNWQGTSMSSNRGKSAEPSGGGKGIFIALSPWIVFTVLASHASLKLGSLAALAAAIVIAVPGVRAGRPKLIEVGGAREQVPERYWRSTTFKEINGKLTTMWACVFAAMVPFHVIAGALDTRAGNIVFNWAIPLGLVVWGIKRSSAAGEANASTVQKAA
jgi:hypothetical protein